MRRREYLPLVAATALPLAGCSETDSTADPSADGSDAGGDNETDSDGGDGTDSEAAFKIRSVDAPEQVARSDPIPVSVTIANTGEADGTYTGTARFDSEGEGTVSLTITRDIEVDVPAGETATSKNTRSTVSRPAKPGYSASGMSTGTPTGRSP
jgi:hypothetical protein